MTRRILVTAALPYANGSIHLGHLVEYIYTDIWVRYLKMRGHDAIYICADDTHGTPIEISARKQGIRPEELIERMHAEHERDFADFQIEFDFFGSTHCDENRRWAERIFLAARDDGHIERREIEQNYCPKDELFLPDRFLRGTCPKCAATDQYGDVCEVCGSTYQSSELLEPHCALCGTVPERRKSEHLFFRLSDFGDFLKQWTSAQGHLQPKIANSVQGWIEDGLRDWDITRDGPYFGFPIPGEENKYFYVWLDAPIGYISNTERWCAQNGRDVADYWERPGTEIYHIIGKDIVYFHVLFWPAMLQAAGLNLPDAVQAHGFLRIGGTKMSKSRGTFINARTFLDQMDPQALRYYYASKLDNGADDLDLSFTDFVNRVNAELVNKISNLASRSISFLNKRLDSRLGKIDPAAAEMISEAEAAMERIAEHYEQRNVAAAIEIVNQLAERGNVYLQNAEPWKLIKDDPEAARNVCTAAVNLSKIITVALKPALPKFAADIERILGIDPLTWNDARADLVDREINEFQHLVDRIEQKQIDAMVEASKVEQQPVEQFDYEVPQIADEIAYDDFLKLDLRVAQVIKATMVEGADKLIRLQISLGPLGERTVFAGMRKAVDDPAVLDGRKVICVANLAPRKMRFGLSEGMVLASTDGKDGNLNFLWADQSAQPGEKVS
ncbi:MAG: methionine--tRNA ligase [Candidatus Alcyoniella australis]|nr:methionine--tRNA ligase [Candidatus Alcyoniella australis]